MLLDDNPLTSLLPDNFEAGKHFWRHFILAFGIVIAMIYVFFDKVFGVMAEQSDFSPLLAVWFPNILFGTLAIYLLYNAKR